MGNRVTPLVANEPYHCFNRGVDKQAIYKSVEDYDYFIKSLHAYNSPHPAGMLRLSHECQPEDQPVKILSYCLLPNHFHILASGKTDGAISKLLQRLGTGYTLYFNQKYGRSGRLFQGTFKSKHVASDQDLRQLIAYVTYNYSVHRVKDPNQYRSYLNTAEVGGLTSYSDFDIKEIAAIITEKRLDME